MEPKNGRVLCTSHPTIVACGDPGMNYLKGLCSALRIRHGLAAFWVMALFAGPVNAADPPNILFIFADDWGWGDLTWTHLGSLGLTWARLDSLEILWKHLDSFGFTETHWDSPRLT